MAKRTKSGGGGGSPAAEKKTSLVAKGPPDGGWGWAVVFGSFMIHIVNDGLTYSFGVLYNTFLSVFRESDAATSWVASLLVGVTLCSGPIVSVFVNKYGCRPVTIAGAVLASACLFVSMYARSLFVLYITIGLGTGLGFGMIYLPAIVSVTCYFEKYRSLATGIAVCGSGLGTFIFSPLVKYLVDNYDWQKTLGVLSGLVFLCTLFGMLFRPLPVAPADDDDDDDEEYGGGGGGGGENGGSVPMTAVANGGVPRVPDIVEPSPVAESEPLNSRSFDHIPNEYEPAEDDEWRKRHRRLSGGKRKTSHNALAAADQKLKSRFALSQPELVAVGSSNGRLSTGQRDHRYYASQSLKPAATPASNGGAGIMYQKDIFYSGSMKNIHLNRRRTISQSTNAGNHVGEIACNGGGGNDVLSSDGGCCSADAKNTIKHMLDFTLLKDPVFIMYTASNFLTSIGFNIPILFLVPHSENIGIQPNEASYLLSVMGIANTLGRIVLGFLSDKAWINRLMVYNLCLTICGIATLLSVYCTNLLTMSLYVIVFGSTIGAYVGLTSVILVDLLGLDKLTNAFGVLLLFQGIASLVGQPMGGLLKDIYGTYDSAFILSGANIAVSGLMLFVLPAVQRHCERRKEIEEKMTAVANNI